MIQELIELARDSGLPGLAIVTVGYVTVKIAPHIKAAWVEDRKNRYENDLEHQKLIDRAAERAAARPTKPPAE